MDLIDGFFEFVAVIVATVSTWIVTRRMRQRVKKTMGRNPSDLELTSLRTWMQVGQDEARQAAKQAPIHPD
jgi:hypothetical protein